MTYGMWLRIKVIVAVSCGAVVLFGPSEVDQLAIGQALPRLVALALLAVISLGSLVAAVAEPRSPRITVWSLGAAGTALILYGVFAALMKWLVALPTAGLAVVVGLVFIDQAVSAARRPPGRC